MREVQIRSPDLPPFQVDGRDIHLYSDAARGRDIVECRSAVCATRPCQNDAICAQHEESGAWYEMSNSGFHL